MVALTNTVWSELGTAQTLTCFHNFVHLPHVASDINIKKSGVSFFILTTIWDPKLTSLEQVEEGKMVGVLLCDQSEAFDLCDHYILVEKLKLMGVEEQTCTWILSYLSGRKQSCFIDGSKSEGIDLPPCGVPQGSIGGPLLRLIFTCDQQDVIHEHQVDGQDLHRGCQEHHQGEQGSCGSMVGYVDDGAFSYGHEDPAVLSGSLDQQI